MLSRMIYLIKHIVEDRYLCTKSPYHQTTKNILDACEYKNKEDALNRLKDAWEIDQLLDFKIVEKWI